MSPNAWTWLALALPVIVESHLMPRAHAGEELKFELPPGHVRVVPSDFAFPYMTRDITSDPRLRRFKTRAHRGGDIVITNDQLIAFAPVGGIDTQEMATDLNWLANVPRDRIASLLLQFNMLSATGFDRLSEHPRLTELVLVCHDVELRSLVEACPNLTRLEISFNEEEPGDVFEGANLAELVKLKNLKRFGFQEHKMTDDSLRHLAACPKLEAIHLMLGKESKVTDRGLRQIAKSAKLREVNISLTSAISAEGLTALAEIPGLEHLIISNASHLDGDFLDDLDAKLKANQCVFELLK